MTNLKRLENWTEHRAGGTDRKGVGLPVVANFWTGGAPTPCEVRSLTPSGAFIVTNEQWYPGTVLRMTLQYDPRSAEVASLGDRARASVSVNAKVTTLWPLEADVEFVYLNEDELRRFEEFLATAQASAHELVAA